ncbi:Cystathionine gamma-synthase [Komagataella phaffii CBS 7435]|uniref:cystathionine gamma-synthase n=2 Tax=Komagataella phaffii TaxID=460519 RepID=C4R1M9_KOMPG|nr:Cystathionine gamma-synthase, converts cysteine into cystathionine [Komagataella phaffii GS115]AOA62467.1 GQ67_00818T0 [Komagataella phaffii]CAH2448065.1 Cystathionine gamma-synthase [Komagataella phaffii CBS 7435]AOA67967.1 GQ68_00571T0 [Komagataella phaffii GS115]CAY69403.1 Cystathionine gamma-synthase, converts cysteine into cystathionine [Komagataella phaffii GS115]CCA38211.1 Cystathionine gamma-synthase [Komagataella phaffii CBS 7435]
MISQKIGDSIPNNTAHAVSVTLPTWEATVGYEEGEDWVVERMSTGYPRFFIHQEIKLLCKLLEDCYGRESERCLVFPTYNVAKRCREFIKKYTKLDQVNVRILQLSTPSPKNEDERAYRLETHISIAFFPASEFSVAKQYWQHSGEGISSRMGEYCLHELKYLAEGIEDHRSNSPGNNQVGQRSRKSRSSRSSIVDLNNNTNEYSTFIEERFGRNLDMRFHNEAKSLLKRRIAGKIGESQDEGSASTERAAISELSQDDVYLYPSGMTSIFNAYLAILSIGHADRKSVCFGFPYVDTLNILKKFGPGVHFYGLGDDSSLDELEQQLASGLKISSLFCECPSNPLLKTPDLLRVKSLAQRYDFLVVVDETIGNFLNIHVLPYADMVVSSLTKVFSGASNVMGGSLILNPDSPHYESLKAYFNSRFEDLYWAQDVIYMERNSRDFETRSDKVNRNAEAVVNYLSNSSLIKEIYYPSLSGSKEHYDKIKTPLGGYGGLLSLVFIEAERAKCFFNSLKLSKGPSLGTNFTLACPYSILAHFQELDEIEKWGVDRNLIRISIGLEPELQLLAILKEALQTASEVDIKKKIASIE